jgi:nitric oxide reductase NorE protein
MTLSIDREGLPPLPPQAATEPTRDELLAARRWVPGEAGIWALILTDLGVFTTYFIVVMFEWNRHQADFESGRQAINLSLGILNTFFLLTASLFVALGVQTLRVGQVRLTQRLFVVSGVCGAAFVVNKYLEWSDKVSHGHTPETNIFFQLYFVITGLHLLHVVIAMILLRYMRAKAGQVVGTPTRQQARFVENCASYWHMVDLLWLVILALFYLMG